MRNQNLSHTRKQGKETKTLKAQKQIKQAKDYEAKGWKLV